MFTLLSPVGADRRALAAESNPTISLSVTPTLPYPIWGQTVTIIATFPGAGANRVLELQRSYDPLGLTWEKIAHLSTDANGVAAHAFRPRLSALYQAVFAGAPDLPSQTSARISVPVRMLAIQRPVHSTPRVVARGYSVTFTTTVRPIGTDLEPGRVVFNIYRRISGKWTLVTWRLVTVDSLGVARLTWTFSRSGEWFVRSKAMGRGDEISEPGGNNPSFLTPIARYTVL